MKTAKNPQLSPRVLELREISRIGQNARKYDMHDDLCITFQIENLGCYKPTPLKMNLALEIWVG